MESMIHFRALLASTIVFMFSISMDTTILHELETKEVGDYHQKMTPKPHVK